jgi:hypothetical protein
MCLHYQLLYSSSHELVSVTLLRRVRDCPNSNLAATAIAHSVTLFLYTPSQTQSVWSNNLYHLETDFFAVPFQTPYGGDRGSKKRTRDYVGLV